MINKPNANANYAETTYKNDLFRKFRNYFILAAEKEFLQFDSYGKDGYISVSPMLEQRIIDTFQNSIDEIVPITGFTGIGKTYLLLYCLKVYYNIINVPTNHPVILSSNNHKDLIYYSDFNITEQSILENPTELCLAKIKAMKECLINHFNIEKTKLEQYVEEYIENNKLEVKFYTQNNIEYQKELFSLVALLNFNEIAIDNIIFIFDDLESLTEKQQFSLMENFLTLYENLKGKNNSKYHSKFIFCLRNNTYFNIYRQDFYNTHRASKAAQLSIAPSLSSIFKKRFDIILKSDKVKKAQNEVTWKEAQDILIDICERIDSSYTNLLLKLNNNNISHALDDFLSILSNRRWTQKNVNPSGSFKIETSDYYINDMNILRILSMGEKKVYYQSMSMPIRCILPTPGVSTQYDLIFLLILRAFRYKNYSVVEDLPNYSNLFSANDLINQVTDLIFSPTGKNINNKKIDLQEHIQTAFLYYEENRFIKKNVDPRAEYNTERYFMLPRGEQIFDLYFSQSILFNIFRDTYTFDGECFDLRCSYELTFDELTHEYLKYLELLINAEKSMFNRITINKKWKPYLTLFGQWSASENLFNGLKNSLQQYYKTGNYIDLMPRDNIDKYKVIEKAVIDLVDVFKVNYPEDDLFDDD